MIKKILSAQEFIDSCHDLEALMKADNAKYQHIFGPICKESMIRSWGHSNLLANTMHTWVNIENNKTDAIIMFHDSIDTKCGKRILNEFFWVSGNAKVSFSLLKKALDFAKSKKIEYVSISSYENHPKAQKLREIYKKIGFIKDVETYMKKI